MDGRPVDAHDPSPRSHPGWLDYRDVGLALALMALGLGLRLGLRLRLGLA